MKDVIYMDNAATTQVSEKVLEGMIPYFRQHYGNPSSIYKLGQETKKAITEAREKVAKALNADPKEIFFTGSGTEADNWAIRSFALENKDKGKHIITSKIEHHAVLHVCEYLEKKHGFEITYIGVDEKGTVDLEKLKNAIKDETILITIMHANNEIGTIQPIKEISEIAKEHKIAFHTDAVQTTGSLNIDVKNLGVDMLSLSAHKFHGPKGVGALYIRKGIKLPAFMIGGGQERGKRGSTENVAGIVGLSIALEEVRSTQEKDKEYLTELRDYLIEEMLKAVPHTRLNGETMLLLLDSFGICGSSGSACTSGSLDPSHVLLAIGLPHEIAHGSLRLSLSTENTKEEIDFVVEKTAQVVKRLRDMSPLYEDFLKKGGK